MFLIVSLFVICAARGGADGNERYRGLQTRRRGVCTEVFDDVIEVSTDLSRFFARCFTFTALNQLSRGKCIAPILAVLNEVRYCIIEVMTKIGVC